MNGTVTLRQLQEIYLDMMKQFHAFCVEHDLTYYMVGGTLLGAVREKGFIPWDDDVDFAMPRPDYERFIRTYSGELEVLNRHNDSKYMFPYTKLFHSQTPILQVEDAALGVNGDVFVKLDVYPIDGVGCDRRKALKLLEKVSQKKRFLYLNLTRHKSKNPVKRVLLGLIRCVPSRSILKNLDRTMQTYSCKKSSFYTRWREGTITANLFDADVLGKPVLLQFEDCSFFAPQNYEEYLTKVYGDFMVERRENAGMRHDTNMNDMTEQFAKQLK